MIYLDTHVLVTLYLGQTGKLSPAARRIIEEEDLVASPAAVLEVEFLHEIGRLRPSALKLVEALRGDLGLRVCDMVFHHVVRQALKENWGRDLFDRLIVANARAAGSPLVTRDERIRRHYRPTVW